MKKKIFTNILKKILIIAFILYFVFTLIKQQQTLNSYANQKTKYNEDIEVAEDEQEELQKTKDNINSDEYIEQVAREKLGMYYPNERVYIDVEKWYNNRGMKYCLEICFFFLFDFLNFSWVKIYKINKNIGGFNVWI